MQSPTTDQVITVLEPPRRLPGLGVSELWRTRRVLLVLGQRQFKVRYGNMVLGAAWVLLEPLAMTLIIAGIMGLVLNRGERYDLPFPVFLFTAWIAIRVFGRVLGQGGSSIRANGTLVARVYVPRAFFPLSVGLVSLVDLVFMIVALLVLLAIYGILPGVGMLALPLLIAILYAFSMGGAFLFSAMSMSLPDVEFVRGLIVRAWFWLSPVIYPSSVVPEEFRNIYYLNPMVVVIDGFRWAFTRTPVPPPEEWLIGTASACTVLVVGYIYFRRKEPYFSDLL